MIKNIGSIEHHRNGVTGESFWVVPFTEEGERLIGIVFEQSRYCAVVSRDNLSNHFRGDIYEHDLRRAIAKCGR